MTLALAVTTQQSIWMLADRRLTKGQQVVRDDACKMMLLDAADGQAIFGYAGLGATELGTEPAEWITRVLLGRHLPIEQSVILLADAAKRELPPHLLALSPKGPLAHSFVATSFVSDEPRVYSIDFVVPPDRRDVLFRCTRHTGPPNFPDRVPELAYGGSGGWFLSKHRRLLRGLRTVVRASDEGRATPRSVADQLAWINCIVSQSEHTVSDRCIVAWRNHKTGIHRGGGGHQFYTGQDRDLSSPALPHIVQGEDMRAVLAIFRQNFTPSSGIDVDKINAALADLKNQPDEKLR